MRVVYVSYDGALDPLGASQVVPYLVGLAGRGVAITLISFEKPERWVVAEPRARLAASLASAGITWRPLTYHKRPRLPATLLDVLAGSRRVRAEVRRSEADLVHCRGDVAMAMARGAGLPAGVRMVYDVRGLFSDERVETGSWTRGGLVDRVVRRAEAGNLRRADAVVVLTELAREALRARRPDLPPCRVIPTCADLAAFTPRPPGEQPEFGLAYCGSLGTWYMVREMAAFARVASAVVPGRVLVLTPHVEQARLAGFDPSWAEVREVPAHEVPRWLRRARALFFFIRPTPAKRASCPTKLAEALATGLPVVANRGVGDLDSVLESEGVGALVNGFTEEEYRRAAQRLADLLRDPATIARCRRLAERRYSLQAGVAAYHELYRALVQEAARPAASA